MLPPLNRTAIFPQLSGRRAAARNFLAVHSGLILCALFLLAGGAAAGDYGLFYDEGIQIQIATANLNHILGRDNGFDALKYQPNVYYGVAFELPLLLAERGLGLEDYHYVHRLRVTLTHLFFIVGGFFCYLLAYRLFNSRLIALFALLLYLLHPRIYAHSFFNSKDPPFLSMFIITLYLLERAFRRDTIGAFALLGIAVGLLTNLRIMGIMLLAAALAMRGLDWFYAEGGPERKHIRRTGGLFALTAGLTLYIVTPYAWTNPGDWLLGNLEQVVDHPVIWPQLFQGEWFPYDQLPPHYNGVWFGITTPPLILLLGVIGMAAVLAQGLRRPGAVFGNGRRRFLLLLAAAFLLPPLAAALLGSNQYADWKHFYFVYAPFGLLAAGGLHWLTAGRARRLLGRAGAYGLAGLGLGLVLLQMTQLHPLQNLYFNFLVDRDTPEHLVTQYSFSFRELGHYAALRRILKSYPGETLVVRAARDNEARTEWDILPPADRERLLSPTADRGADYELIYPTGPGQPDLFFNSAYRRLYNNTITALRPLKSSRMTASAIAAYREIYRTAVAGEPVVRADYDVYRQGQRLTFVQENCPPESPDAWFGARLFPPDPEIRPPGPGFHISDNRSNHRVWLGAANLQRENFHNPRVEAGDICLAVIKLPAAARGHLILSQRALGELRPTGDPLGQELYSLSSPGLRERIAQLRPGAPAAGPAAFEVFLDQVAGRYRLLYAKAECAPAEYETPVFLHILPEKGADLPFYLWESGFDNREFPLPRYGLRLGGECLAVYPLPDYPFTALRTGQAGVWERNIYPPADPDPLRATYAALAAIQPAARSAFSLYIQDNQLTYIRESCAAADTAEPFFLHIFPAAADLLAGPAAEQDNRDFAFGRWGGHFDGKCLAAVPLPDYPIAAIRTGQAGLWEVNYYPPADPEPLRAAYAALSDIQPAVQADFDLYAQDDRLIYLRESCAAADTAARFFLHIVPEDIADLPADRRDAGFAHAGFAFARWGGHFDGQCLAAIPLPDYPVKEIRTGQHIPGQGDLWSVALIAAPNLDQLRADYAALSAAEPAARSYFDLYWRDDRLIYLRENCAAEDTAAGFFLHIVPVDVADLPADRRPAGFAHAGFAFARQGGHFDGKCLAAVPLPDFPIKEMRTGQYVPEQGDLWSARLPVER